MALDPQKIPKGQSPEVTEQGSRNKVGVYKHLESGSQLVASNVPQADAFALQGWVYKGPVAAKDIESVSSTGTPEKVDHSSPEVKELRAKLAAERKARKAAEEKAEALSQTPPAAEPNDDETKGGDA